MPSKQQNCNHVSLKSPSPNNNQEIFAAINLEILPSKLSLSNPISIYQDPFRHSLNKKICSASYKCHYRIIRKSHLCLCND